MTPGILCSKNISDDIELMAQNDWLKVIYMVLKKNKSIYIY